MEISLSLSDRGAIMDVFVGDDVVRFQAVSLASALKLYAKTGIKANRAYTPTAMMRTAQKITGKTFASRDYMGASKALLEWAKEG